MQYELALKIFEELRKEILSSQKIRTQMIGFKITFTSAALGIVFANYGNVPYIIFFIPAFASVFFDLLILSYGFSIKRMGTYIQKIIEPIFREYTNWPGEECPFWEEWMSKPSSRQNLTFIGNIGFTILVSTPAIFLTYMSFMHMENASLSFLSLGILLIFSPFLLYDIIRFIFPRKLINSNYKYNCLKDNNLEK